MAPDETLYLLRGVQSWLDKNLIDKGIDPYNWQESLVVDRYQDGIWQSFLATTYPTQGGTSDYPYRSALEADVAVGPNGAAVVWLDTHENWEENDTLRLRTTQIISTTVPQITKHYYANGQRIASQVDDALYYVLSDPAGHAALFADNTGQAVGHLIFDSSGEVVTTTLPLTLTEKLVSRLNLAANLQYTGQGWYEAGLGLHLQPGSVGGAPARFDPMGMSGGGVYIPSSSLNAGIGSVNGWNYNPVSGVVGAIKTWADKHYQVQIGQALERLIPRRYTIPVNYGTALISLSTGADTLSNPRFINLLESLNGRVSWANSRLVRLNIPVTGVLDFEAEAGRLARSFEPFGEVTQVRGFARGFYYAAEGIDPKVVARLRGVFGFGLDAGIGAGFQLYEDWGNPNLTGYQIAGRASVSGGGSALFAGIAAAIFCGETGGVGCLIVAGIGGGLLWSEVGQPIVFEKLFPEIFQPTNEPELLETP